MRASYSRLRILSVICALLAAAYATHAQGDRQSATPDLDVISIDTSLVTINVSVTDHKHRQLPGLKLEDFRVTDQGKTVQPEFMDSQGALSLVFVVDVSSSMKANWRDLKDSMKKFLAKEHPDSDYTLVTFNEKAQLVTSSVDAEQLWQSFSALQPGGDTALYDGLLLGLQALDRARQRHKALVLLSDGQDNCSHEGLTLVEQQTLLHQATIYSVGIILESDPSRYGLDGKNLLNQLAAATGGLVMFPKTKRLPAVLNLISADLSQQYSLSYYPPEKTPGWHQVEINIAQTSSRLNLRYQRRYQMR